MQREYFPGNIRAANTSELAEETERRNRQLVPDSIQDVEEQLAQPDLSPLARATLRLRIADMKRG